MTDTEEIRAVLDGIHAAWAANDADAFVRDYAPDATAQLPGTSLAGRDAIRAVMAEVFAGPLKGSTATYEIRGTRFLGKDTAVVVSAGEVRPADATTPSERALETWVLHRENREWHVAAFHNSPA